MISVAGGVALYDYAIGTFSAEIGGVVYGGYTGEFPTVESLNAVINCLTEDDVIMLNKEKAISDGTFVEE